MENMHSFWQLGDELRGQSRVSEDHQWLIAASKLAEKPRPKGDHMNNPDVFKAPLEARMWEKMAFQEVNKYDLNLNFNVLNLECKVNENMSKSHFRNGLYEANAVCQKSNLNALGNLTSHKYYSNSYCSKEQQPAVWNTNDDNNRTNNAVEERFKTLPAVETRGETRFLEGTFSSAAMILCRKT